MPEIPPEEMARLANKALAADVDCSRLDDGGYAARVIHFQGTIVWGNAAVADILECVQDDIPGINAFTLYPMDSIAVVMEKLKNRDEAPYEVKAFSLKRTPLVVRLEAVNFEIEGQPGRIMGVKLLEKS